MKERERPIRRRVFVALLVTTALVVAAPGASWALWRASATAPAVSLSAGVVPAPGQPTCANLDEGILSLTRSAVVSWPAVSGATSYVVTVRNAAGTTTATSAPQTATSIKITRDVLSGLLSGLLALLLGGDPLYVTVWTVHSSGWRSAPSPHVLIRSSLLPIGVQCATQ